MVINNGLGILFGFIILMFDYLFIKWIKKQTESYKIKKK